MGGVEKNKKKSEPSTVEHFPFPGICSTLLMFFRTGPILAKVENAGKYNNRGDIPKSMIQIETP
jgi:hypothetical protein